jgi:hypothetical protein
MPHALHTSHCTLHTSHFTLHTSHFTLHTSHFTLHSLLAPLFQPQATALPLWANHQPTIAVWCLSCVTSVAHAIVFPCSYSVYSLFLYSPASMFLCSYNMFLLYALTLLPCSRIRQRFFSINQKKPTTHYSLAANLRISSILPTLASCPALSSPSRALVGPPPALNGLLQP